MLVKNLFKLGIIFAALSVVVGAFGAHGLESTIKDKMDVYKTAVHYQMFHSLAILFVSILQYSISDLDLSICIWLFFLGIILFSGSLYILALTNIKWLGAITPIGGLLFIIGWGIVFFKTFNSSI